jgi:hypothetical protein
MNDSGFRRPLETALDSALRYLAGLDRMPVASRVDGTTVRRRFAKPLTDAGVSLKLCGSGKRRRRGDHGIGQWPVLRLIREQETDRLRDAVKPKYPAG